MTTTTPPPPSTPEKRAVAEGPIAVEYVRCPGCGADEAEHLATGPDYDHHCAGDQLFHMVRCRRCELAYLNPRPTTEMLPAIYPSESYVCYDFAEKSSSFVARAREKRGFAKLKPVLQHLRVPLREARVLDLGAGDGTLLRTLHSGGVPAANLTGVDIDERGVEALRRLGFQGVQGRLEELEFPEGSFDLITISHVIEHVADPRRVMEMAFRGLAPGGLFWIETPNIGGWDWPLFRRETWGGYHFPRHWVMFSTKTIRRMLEETRFEVVEVSTLAATFVWVWSINHILQKAGWPRLAHFFRLENPLPLGFFWIFDTLPSLLGWSSNMRAIGRR